jgi:hypothetical protein
VIGRLTNLMSCKASACSTCVRMVSKHTEVAYHIYMFMKFHEKSSLLLYMCLFEQCSNFMLC